MDVKRNFQNFDNVVVGAVRMKPIRIETSPVSSVPESTFKSKAVFDGIRTRLENEGQLFVQKINGVYCFKIKQEDNEGIWIVDLKNGNGTVQYGSERASDVIITVADDSFMQMHSGKLSPPEAFMKGQLKVQGNLGLAFKLRQLLENLRQSKL